MAELKFSVKLKSVPVEIEGTDGVKHQCTLKELTGKQRDIYLNDMGKRMTFVKGEPAGLNDFEGLQTGLLTLCLFDENNTPIAKEVLEGYPSGVLTKLFVAAQELSGLAVDATATAKND